MQQCRPHVCCYQSVADGVGEKGQLAELLQLLLMPDLLLVGGAMGSFLWVCWLYNYWQCSLLDHGVFSGGAPSEICGCCAQAVNAFALRRNCDPSSIQSSVKWFKR